MQIPPLHRNRIPLLFFTLALIFPALACNYPQSSSQPTYDLDKIVQQTLAATLQAHTTSQPAAGTPDVITATPAPASHHSMTAVSQPDLSTDLSSPSITYLSMPGDTLEALALRFNLEPDQITSDGIIPDTGLIPIHQALTIPTSGLDSQDMQSSLAALPDAEVIYSASAQDFSAVDFIQESGGFLSTYHETVGDQDLTGAEIIQRLSSENSINPRLILAALEFRSGWLSSSTISQTRQKYPIGYYVDGYTGLYMELSLVAKQLGKGYYGWRSGELTSLDFAGGGASRIDPRLNAGTVAAQVFIAGLYTSSEWEEALYGADGLLACYQRLFGDPWERAVAVEPIFPDDLTPPEIELPFTEGIRWSLTGGPHTSWLTYTPRGAIDFAPVTGEPACAVSSAWATAVSSGLIVRSSYNAVALDLDGDGYEGSGWVIVYMHLADEDRVDVGAYVQTDDPLGHPSCEGGNTTGTHVHIARKYNGEWIAADGPFTFTLSGWLVRQGEKNYQGYLVRGDDVITAQSGGNQSSIITRSP